MARATGSYPVGHGFKSNFRYQSSAFCVEPLRPVGQAVKTPPFHGGNTSSILVRVTKKFDLFQQVDFFYPLRKQWYIITLQRVYHRCRRISSAVGCIPFRNDDIQCSALVICNSCGINDIHALRRDFLFHSQDIPLPAFLTLSLKYKASNIFTASGIMHGSTQTVRADKKPIGLPFFT